ncbi:INO80 complex subunit C [Fasciola gigantica]|uniref:INO80 complex subunit C n=2 Tax=Fasciola TaxID=6191 RepID=A0A4E0RWC9_FASHE|nr:INO80 complex subunit C [Fasciola hepatica]TPP61512.1 INO80 complex subunit C [Fasciola gigantica]
MNGEHSFKKSNAEKTNERRVVFKNFKQIFNAESQLDYPKEAIRYYQINAPPSLRPAVKVSDLSGIPTAYTDPSTQLHYATSQEFSTVRNLPPELISGYLALRGMSND